MSYKIELAKESESGLVFLHKADGKLFEKILAMIDFLSENPEEGKPLVGNHKGEYSLRVGNYRIVYELDTTTHIVYVLTAKHRKHVY